MSSHSISLPYCKDSSQVFATVAALPWAVYLDSCQPHSEQGRYDIIAAMPRVRLITHGKQTTIFENDNQTVSTDDPLSLIKKYLEPFNSIESDSPFHFGAIGYLSYDLGRRFEKLPEFAKYDLKIPDMAIGIYEAALVIDHYQKTAQFFYHSADGNLPENASCLLEALNKPKTETEYDAFALTDEEFSSNMNFTEYSQKFKEVKKAIYDGNCYQINLAQRFKAKYQGSAWNAYKHLRQLNPAPYSAFLNYEDCTILSLSPERFLQVKNNCVETKPIKGTMPRFSDPLKDKESAATLLKSEKDFAENLMIVDLLRNDLGKVCEPGSIKVPQLCALESFPNVHHLVSTIKGKLAKNRHSLDLLRAAFPGGSITGAPKISAMKIIEGLEPHRRNIYCGSVVYIDANGDMDSNITIRTLTANKNTLYCSAGGGLVADSICESEYQETFDKVNVLLNGLKNCPPKFIYKMN